MLDALQEPFLQFVRPTDKLYWFYLVITVGIAFVLFIRRHGDGSLLDFVRFVAPKSIWTHRSTRTDVGYFLLNRILFFALFAPLVAGAFPVTNAALYALLDAILTPQTWQAPTWLVALFVAAALILADFARFLAHYAQHKIEFLWKFHKVHHSAEVLSPITVYRMHPVDDLLSMLMVSVSLAIGHAVFSFLFVNDMAFWLFTGSGVAVMVFYLLGYNLRHSHIWLSYGPRLSRWLISPAQHQIHHSSAEQHLDRNMGFMLACWDRLFGTLYVPAREERLEYGLAGEDTGAAYSSVWRCYGYPFYELAIDLKGAWRGRPRQLALSAIAGAMVLAAGVSIALPESDPTADIVELEHLTWHEVEARLGEGYTTAIVPTAGVEQNGRHLILGKHKVVVTRAATEIAHRLGNTLVAPAVNFVPEGDISPPSGHMLYSGTLSVRPETFAAILRDTSESLIAHGFNTIYLVGDSGGNQEIQAAVAAELTIKHGAQGVRVAHIGDYYDNNGQREWLAAQGFADIDIGGHAGVRDSSELLYVDAKHIREQDLRTPGQRAGIGVSGAYWKASETIGAKMLELKVAAATRQIRALETMRLDSSLPD